MAKRLVLPTSYHKVADSNHNGSEILPEPNRHCNAQNCFFGVFFFFFLNKTLAYLCS